MHPQPGGIQELPSDLGLQTLLNYIILQYQINLTISHVVWPPSVSNFISKLGMTKIECEDIDLLTAE